MDSYNIIKKIGQGAYSNVYKCIDHSNKVYALKVYRKDEFYKNAGEFEIEILKQLKGCSYFPQLREYFCRQGSIYLIQDYLSCNLEEKLVYHTYSIQALKKIAKEILLGLQYLSRLKRPIIHGDLKLDNIMINGNNNIKIIDFSNAFYLDKFDRKRWSLFKTISSFFQTSETPYIQAIPYRAPEIILETDLVEKVDIWSVGCILAELFTGNILFDFHNNQDKLHLEAIFNMIGEDYSITEYVTNNIIDFFFEIDSNHDFYLKKSYKVSPNRTLESVLRESTIGKRKEDLSNFIDFLKCMLVINPIDRWSIDELLEHDYLMQ